MHPKLLNFEPKDNLGVVGATCCRLGDRIYVVGGDNGIPQSVLRVSCYNLGKGAWEKVYFNSNHIPNRTYACSGLAGKNMYLFGGFTDIQESQISRDIVVMSESECGLIASESRFHECAAHVGQVAVAVGRDKKNLLLLGGAVTPVTAGHISDGEGQKRALFSSDLWLWVRPGVDSENILKEQSWPRRIEINTGDREPSGRAYHSASVCDDAGQLVIVSGGRSSEGILADLWLLDLTAVLSAEEALLSNPGGSADPQDKNQKKGAPAKQKGAPLVPCARWIEIVTSGTHLPRQMHLVCFSSGGTSADVKSIMSGRLYIFGGISTFGPLTVNPDVLDVTLFGDGKIEKAEAFRANPVGYLNDGDSIINQDRSTSTVNHSEPFAYGSTGASGVIMDANRHLSGAEIGDSMIQRGNTEGFIIFGGHCHYHCHYQRGEEVGKKNLIEVNDPKLPVGDGSDRFATRYIVFSSEDLLQR
jgi:Galactose oxidase, central domain/Kelch motif